MLHRPDHHLPHLAIIDDDPGIRDVMHALLHDEYPVILVWDGLDDPLAFIDRCQPDLIIQDVRLGSSVTIWSVLDHLATFPANHTPPVIACSADHAFLFAHEQPLRDRNCAVVAKPFDIDVFLGAVASSLSRRG